MLNNVQHPQLMHIAFRLSKKLKVCDWQYSYDMKWWAWICQPCTFTYQCIKSLRLAIFVRHEEMGMNPPTYHKTIDLSKWYLKRQKCQKIFLNVKWWTISFEKILFVHPKDRRFLLLLIDKSIITERSLAPFSLTWYRPDLHMLMC